MTLPETVRLCDAIELATIAIGKPLFSADFAKQLFPAQQFDEIESALKEAFQLSLRRRAAAPTVYPFDVTERSLSFQATRFTGSNVNFNVYAFLLLGRSLEFGGPPNTKKLQEKFRRHFEDTVSWSLRRAGFLSEVLSKPRGYRGLHTQLKPALRQISERFRESAILKEERLQIGRASCRERRKTWYMSRM